MCLRIQYEQIKVVVIQYLVLSANSEQTDFPRSWHRVAVRKNALNLADAGGFSLNVVFIEKNHTQDNFMNKDDGLQNGHRKFEEGIQIEYNSTFKNEAENFVITENVTNGPNGCKTLGILMINLTEKKNKLLQANITIKLDNCLGKLKNSRLSLSKDICLNGFQDIGRTSNTKLYSAIFKAAHFYQHNYKHLNVSVESTNSCLEHSLLEDYNNDEKPKPEEQEKIASLVAAISLIFLLLLLLCCIIRRYGISEELYYILWCCPCVLQSLGNWIQEKTYIEKERDEDLEY